MALPATRTSGQMDVVSPSLWEHFFTFSGSPTQEPDEHVCSVEDQQPDIPLHQLVGRITLPLDSHNAVRKIQEPWLALPTRPWPSSAQLLLLWSSISMVVVPDPGGESLYAGLDSAEHPYRSLGCVMGITHLLPTLMCLTRHKAGRQARQESILSYTMNRNVRWDDTAAKESPSTLILVRSINLLIRSASDKEEYKWRSRRNSPCLIVAKASSNESRLKFP